jgi:hypothetical protein
MLPLYERWRVWLALEAIRARGEPLVAEEILAKVPEHPSRFVENAARFRDIRNLAFGDSFAASEIDDYFAGPNSARADADTIAALHELRSCLDSTHEKDEDLLRYESARLTSSIAAGVNPSDCERLAHHARRLCLEPTIESASELCRGDPADLGASLRDFVGTDLERYQVNMQVTEVRPAVGNLVNSAVDLALEGKESESQSRLLTAAQGARTIEGGLWHVEYGVWESAELRIVEGLKAILPRVRAGLDLHELESVLDPTKPRPLLVRALQGARAFGNNLYVNFFLHGESAKLARGSWRTLLALPYDTLIHRDQATYLEWMTKGIDAAKIPYWTWKERGEAISSYPTSDPRLLPMGMLFAPDVPTRLSLCARLEAEMSLARAALTAYREGSDAGARAATSATDPFTGKPLRSRIDPDGTLVLWSVGANLVDDGGDAGDSSEDPPKDLVWRIPKR